MILQPPEGHKSATELSNRGKKTAKTIHADDSIVIYAYRKIRNN